jgi:UDP-N-acetylglucosamine 1-carboxyvinyltransferase
MESFIIEGGRPLRGTITPQGAKNEALEVIAAVLLTPEPVRITNIPDILDVNNLIRLLQDVGVKVMRNGKGDFTFQADELNLEFLASDEYVKKCAALRGSVLMMGPLLARFGKAVVAEPGGDKIGRRRLDTHICKFPSRYNLAYSNGSSIASDVKAQSDPGVVLKFFSASQQSIRSI